VTDGLSLLKVTLSPAKPGGPWRTRHLKWISPRGKEWQGTQLPSLCEGQVSLTNQGTTECCHTSSDNWAGVTRWVSPEREEGSTQGAAGPLAPILGCFCCCALWHDAAIGILLLLLLE
jgi:hypothetical protein